MQWFEHAYNTMLFNVFASFFKFKVVRSIVIIACWRPLEQNQFIREIMKHGFSATFLCNSTDIMPQHEAQVVLYLQQFKAENSLKKINMRHYAGRTVWLVVGDGIPPEMHDARYDADITLLRTKTGSNTPIFANGTVELDDIYVHPSIGATLHPWGSWSDITGLHVLYERERILRRLDLKGHPLRIAAPLGQYSDEWYEGSFAQYVVDEHITEMDGGIRCAYAASALIIQLLNATEVIVTTELWGTTVHNSSMILQLKNGGAELGGGILRILPYRLENMDYILPIWPFQVGFTYLGDRESSSNMFVAPFSGALWASCLAIGLVLALALKATARSQDEKDDAYCAVLATFLQQDASSVPRALSGRWTFVMLSVCAMLVHAYYTSAIVSALMSAGSGGPESLRALADSKYAIASEDYDYIRFMFFDVETTWADLEYLKKKKKTSKFYQLLERGVELIEDGSTAFHTEYNQIYPYFKRFSDDQICKLKHIDTIPEVMAWMTTSRQGQYTNTFRVAGARLLEAGLSKRVVSRLLALKPSCRAQLLAERVKFGDVAPLIALTLFGAFLSILILVLEIYFARNNRCGKEKKSGSIEENLPEMGKDEE